MCIIIANGSKNPLKKSVLQNCYNNNPDGMGLAYVDYDKRIKIFKELKNFEYFYKKYLEIKTKRPQRNILLHFRIATHGAISEQNIHPFVVDENLVFAHNGIININILKGEEDVSDTVVFNEKILKNLPKNFYRNKAIISLLESRIETSKIVFLNTNNRFYILNEIYGTWNNKNWFSNFSYRTVKSKKKKYTSDYFWNASDKHNYYIFDDDYNCLVCGSHLNSYDEYSNQMCKNCMKEYLVK